MIDRLAKFILLTVLLSVANMSVASSAESPQIIWSANGVLINDTIGASNQKSPKIAAIGGGRSIIVWVDERNGYTNIYAQKIDGSGVMAWGGDGISICNEPKNQSSPQIISDEAGGAIIVWEDYRQGEADIYAQKVDPQGRPLWNWGGVAISSAKGGQLAPRLAPDGSGGAVITWYDYRSGRGEDIYAQRIDAGGAVKWKADGTIVSAAPGTQWYPEIISDSSKGAMIVWTDFRSGKGSDVYAQRLDMDGNPLWQADGLPVCFVADNQAYPKIAGDGAGGVLIVWDDFRTDNFDIYAQRIDPSGKPLWQLNGIPIAKTALNEERPDICYVPGDGAIICWLSRRGERADLLAQKVSLKGELLWNELGVAISKASGEKENYNIISSGDEGAIIAWEDMRSGLKAIYGQKISADGSALWDLDGAQICAQNEDCELPDMVQVENNKTVIVWQDKRNGDLDIFGQSMSPDGSADWNSNGAIINSSQGSVNQQNPAIAYDKDGSHVVVWEDARSGYLDVFAQKIDPSGKILWGLNGVPIIEAPGTQKGPQITSDGRGSMLVAWEDNRTGRKWDIYAQKIGPDGTFIWPASGVLLSKSGSSKSRVRIISADGGNLIAVWEEERGGGRQDVYAQKVDAKGGILWGDEGIALCKAPSDQVSPVIASDRAGGAIVAWVDYRNGSFNADIYSQKINSGGAATWKDNGVPVCTAPDSQKSPDICPDGREGAIVVWTDKGGGDYDIYAQIIDRGGNPTLTADGIPVCQAPGTQRDAKITYSVSGEAVIAWNDFRNANWDIYAQKINSFGQLIWRVEGAAICTAPLTQYSPEIVSGPWGSIISWEDYRNGKNYNIYAQKLDDLGMSQWQEGGIAVANGPDGQRNPQIAPNGGGGAVIAWEDYRSGGFGIYAQKIKVIKLE